MIETTITLAALLAIAIVIPMLLVIHTRSDLTFLKGTSLISVLLAAIIAATTTFGILGSPTVPIIGLTIPSNKIIDILSYHIVPQQNIYLVLGLDSGPKIFRFEWSDEEAKKLEEEGGEDMVISTFKPSDGGPAGNEEFGIVGPGAIADRPHPNISLPAKEPETSPIFRVP